MTPLDITVHNTPQGLATAAQTLLQHAGQEKVWALIGDLGAGKTTLVRALCAQLGVQDNVSSPTFALIHEYATATDVPIYHFDFYRLHHADEALELDCTAYFDSGHYCFVEWPHTVMHWLPTPHYRVHLTPISQTSRRVEASMYPPLATTPLPYPSGAASDTADG